jgi:chromatin remodeling complex protein RSC6
MTSSLPTSELDKITKSAGDIQHILSSVKSQITTLQQKVRMLEKQAKESSRKRRNKGPSAPTKPRQPTGFARPSVVSNELLRFMGKQQGVLVARTEATRAVNRYIKQNSLQDSKDARIILPDANLRDLLQIKSDSGPLTFFNLQRHMNIHFRKKASEDADSSE